MKPSEYTRVALLGNTHQVSWAPPHGFGGNDAPRRLRAHAWRGMSWIDILGSSGRAQRALFLTRGFCSVSSRGNSARGNCLLCAVMRVGTNMSDRFHSFPEGLFDVVFSVHDLATWHMISGEHKPSTSLFVGSNRHAAWQGAPRNGLGTFSHQWGSVLSLHVWSSIAVFCSGSSVHMILCTRAKVIVSVF